MEKMTMFFLMAALSVMSSIVYCNDHSKSVSPELSEPGHEANLLRMLEEPQQEDSSSKRAVGMLRMGRSLPYYVDDDAGVKRAVSYLRMGRSGLNDKRAVNMLRMGKRAVSLLRMGRSSNNNNQFDEQYDEEANSPSRKFFYDNPNYFVDDAERENYKLAHDGKRAVSMLRMG